MYQYIQLSEKNIYSNLKLTFFNILQRATKTAIKLQFCNYWNFKSGQLEQVFLLRSLEAIGDSSIVSLSSEVSSEDAFTSNGYRWHMGKTPVERSPFIILTKRVRASCPGRISKTLPSNQCDLGLSGL